MPRPDPREIATTESRRKGAERANEVRRERAKGFRQRLAEKLDAEADELIAVALTSARGGDWRALVALVEQAFGKAPAPLELGGPGGEVVRFVVESAFPALEGNGDTDPAALPRQSETS